jgi:nicotinate-nucleotide adenylyltransferase
MRIGIFGGTFDPPHIGHLILAAETCAQLSLDRLLWVLTPNPPHKHGHYVTPLPIRLALVRAAIRDDASFELSTVDIDRPGPHFSVDTVRLIRKEFPNDVLVYLMGGDSLSDLPSWHTPQAFVNQCHEIGVMRRPGDHIDLLSLENILPGLTSKVRFIDAPLMGVTATDIRAHIANGKPYRYYLLPAVYELIQRYKLYQEEVTEAAPLLF